VVAFLNGLKSQGQIVVLPDSDRLFDEGMRLFSSRNDQEWSLTDCISFEAMRAHDLTEALTADHHFAQAGFKLLLDRVG
jgi:predicted nucleic acid-binding protein